MKVLYYNWTPLDCKMANGGGVAVYIKNLLSFFEYHRNEFNIETTYLSSGFYYDNKNETYIRKEKSLYNSNIYTIVNSDILAPLGFPESMYHKILTDKNTVDIFDIFLQKTGPYDVIHFNSFEGLSPNVLSLKSKYPYTKFIHTIHDYGIFCPNVKFWTKNNTNCVTDNNRPKCFECMKSKQLIPITITKRERPKTCNSEIHHKNDFLMNLYKKLLYKSKIYYYYKKHDETTYIKYRNLCVNMINNNIDVEIAVSNRVGEIAKRYGINPIKIKTSYIGTLAAENQQKHNINENGIFTMLYMGYMSIEKGYFSYIDCLEEIDENISSHINLKFATKITDISTYKRTLRLKRKFHDIIFYDGYTHSDFPQIMENVSLGIVPPLWEDNLPQVAIEMIANGIPVLSCNNGGAHELNTHPDFTYHDKYEFKNKIEKIALNHNLLNEYWEYSVPLTTMRKHISNLIEIYKS